MEGFFMTDFRLSYKDKTKSRLDFRATACKCCKSALRTVKTYGAYEASLTVVSDEEIREYNRNFRNIDRATDVLSFPMNAEDYITGAVILGDIMISLPAATRQSQEYGHTLIREMSFLTVHGMLHLLGYDHKNKSEEKAMFNLQEQILQKLGLFR